MRIVRINGGNRREIASNIQQYTQILPFFMTNSEARRCYSDGLRVAKNSRYVGVEKRGTLLALMSYQQHAGELIFETLLLKNTPGDNQATRGLSFWLKQLEKVAKLARAKCFSFQLKAVDVRLASQLQALGFHQIAGATHQQWQKTLTYQTGLVLAGGGARGAYQIGAWRALKKLGIEFDIISGTSVGALNGGLILQDDLEAAEIMWSHIDTGKILTFPGMVLDKSFSVNGILKDIQHFAMSAVVSQGVSTEPLQNLINDLLDEERMATKKQQLFLCTTQLPQMKEVVVSFSDVSKGEFHRWLLASSSFFPAMKAAKISGKYYVDGGYRNNIPVDVALKNGATELIIVDVKGPGLTKSVSIPSDMPVVKVASPWSLGAVLLFDGARSQWNIQLGYLETMKAFGCYIGYWYTFDHDSLDQAVRDWRRELAQGVFGKLTQAERELMRNSQVINDLSKKIRMLYQDRMSASVVSIYVLEMCAKFLGISPVKCYTIETMIGVIKEKMSGEWLTGTPEEGMLLSLQEWLRLYTDELPLPTDKQQIIFFYRQLKGQIPDQLILSAASLAPTMYLVAKTLIWLEG